MSSAADNQVHIRVATGLSLAVSTTCVILRFYARRLLRQRVYWDDVLILLALVCEWGIGVAGLILLENGLGLHIIDVTPHQITTYMKVLYAGAPLYALTIMCIKFSLLSLYHRLFAVKYMSRSCFILSVIVAAWGIATIFGGLFLCNPVHKFWAPQTPGQCLDLEKFYYAIQIPNIITDIAILVLPIRAIYILPVERTQKWLLSGIFGLGVLVVVFDIIRFTVMVKLAQTGADITWNQVATSIWTCVEPSVAISVACLAHLRPVLKRVKHYWKPPVPSRSDCAKDSSNCQTGSTLTPVNGSRNYSIVEEHAKRDPYQFGPLSPSSTVHDVEACGEEPASRKPSHTPLPSLSSQPETEAEQRTALPQLPS